MGCAFLIHYVIGQLQHKARLLEKKPEKVYDDVC